MTVIAFWLSLAFMGGAITLYSMAMTRFYYNRRAAWRFKAAGWSALFASAASWLLLLT